MVCDECGKQKATVHLTEIINDQITKLNLCEYCAKKKGTQLEQHFGIADLLQGLAEQDPPTLSPKIQKLKCNQCGMYFDQFKKIGRLGCSGCYEAFRTHLSQLLKRIHSSSSHVGKCPNANTSTTKAQATKKKTTRKSTASKPKATIEKSKHELADLKQLLKKAIEKEAYEDAAQLRDKIKKAETKLKKA